MGADCIMISKPVPSIVSPTGSPKHHIYDDLFAIVEVRGFHAPQLHDVLLTLRMCLANTVCHSCGPQPQILDRQG